jgi:hypothetical protein
MPTFLGVTWLDYDFQDAHYLGDVPVTLDSFRTDVLKCCDRLGIDRVNAGLFLYDYEYPSARPFPSPYLRFVGCFAYETSHPKWFDDPLAN